MPLYNSGTLIADVQLTDTFNTWRTRFNNALADASGITANNTFTGQLNTFTKNVDIDGPLNAPILTSNNAVIQSLNASFFDLDGDMTADVITANSVAGTLTTAAQGNITSLGTLTTLTVDNVIVNGTTIGHTSDTDLMTLASGVVTVAGELSATTLDIGGTNISATAAEINQIAGITDGTAAANKAMIPDANIDITAIRNLTTTGNIVVGGNFTVNGTTSTVSSTNTVVSDNLIELNNGASSNANDSGIVIERGSTGDNAFIGWDESADRFIVGTTTATGADTGNLSITKGTLNADLAGDVTGTIQTAAQANITSVGTLTSLTLGGTLNMGGNSLQNATYTDLHPTTHVLSNSDLAIDFSIPLNKMVMDSARTFTEENKAAGRMITMLLDTSTSDHDPTFSSNIKWHGAETPTWDDYRYWIISMVCLDSTTVFASATGHDT